MICTEAKYKKFHCISKNGDSSYIIIDQIEDGFHNEMLQRCLPFLIQLGLVYGIPTVKHVRHGKMEIELTNMGYSHPADNVSEENIRTTIELGKFNVVLLGVAPNSSRRLFYTLTIEEL